MVSRPSGDEENAMRLPRFQFTIRRLILLIAICGVCFALLRIEGGFLIVYVGILLLGFFVARARGGLGPVEGACSAAAVSAFLLVVWILQNLQEAHYPTFSAGIVIVLMFSLIVLCSFTLGWVLTGGLYLVIEVTKIMLHPELQIQSPDEIAGGPVMATVQTPATPSDLDLVSDKAELIDGTIVLSCAAIEPP
jgi:hypothetical protein